MGAWAGGTGELAFGWGEAGSAFTTAFSGPGPGAAGGSGWMLPEKWPVDGTRSLLTESWPQSAGLLPRPAARLLPATLSRCRGAVLLPGRCLLLLVPFAEWRAAELPDAQVLIACLVARLMPVAPCVCFAALLQEPEVLLACIAARLMPVLPCVCFAALLQQLMPVPPFVCFAVLLQHLMPVPPFVYSAALLQPVAPCVCFAELLEPEILLACIAAGRRAVPESLLVPAACFAALPGLPVVAEVAARAEQQESGPRTSTTKQLEKNMGSELPLFCASGSGSWLRNFPVLSLVFIRQGGQLNLRSRSLPEIN